MPLLRELNVSSNNLSELNVSENELLENLSAYGNKLTTLDLSNNPNLSSLLVQNNQLTGLDLSNQKALSLIYVGGNGWDACTLNDFYYSLNPWKEVKSDYGTGNTLWVTENGATKENDAAHAESDLATGKGWKVNTEGDGTGCDMAYVTILDTENGTVKLTDANNTEVKSGDKVKKNSVITLEAVPASGYELSTAKANGVDIVNNQFTVTKATDVLVKFTVASSISQTESTPVTVEGGQHEIVFTTSGKIPAAVYTLGGRLMFEGNVSGEYAVSVPAGVYVVKIAGVTKKLLVK